MKIGILGGTFNPPHTGHIVIAKEAKEKLGLDKVFFIPTNIPPHKDKEDIDSSHRLQMVRIATQKNSSFEVLDLEIKRGGVSYTIDTVKELKQKYPEVDFYLIIGSDLANKFSSWKDYQELKNLVKIVVAQREDNPLKNTGDFKVIDITQIDICSSKIREMIRQGKSVDEYLDKDVKDYIEQHKLYKG
jgi:nicotinate-nucleotide adenylyltransferase